jgi:four helix bundle protein
VEEWFSEKATRLATNIVPFLSESQMQRAAVSVSANIAEGYERGSRKEYAQFLMIAKGSAGELRCLLRIAERLQFIDSSSADKLIADITEVSRMLRGLANAVRKSVS